MNPDNLGKVEVKINLVIIIVLSVLALSATFYFTGDAWQERLKFFLTLCGGGAAIYGAYYAGITLKQSISRNLAQRSFELIDKLSEVDYVGVRRFIRTEIQNHEFESNNTDDRLKEIQNKINNSDELHDKVHHLLGFIESMSEQIQCGFVNETILYEHCYYIVLNAYRHLRDYIETERASSDDASDLYIHVEKLYDKWKDQLSLQTGNAIVRISDA